jgi:hypothetical protein
MSGWIFFCSLNGHSKLREMGLEFCISITILKILNYLILFFSQVIIDTRTLSLADLLFFLWFGNSENVILFGKLVLLVILY